NAPSPWFANANAPLIPSHSSFDGRWGTRFSRRPSSQDRRSCAARLGVLWSAGGSTPLCRRFCLCRGEVNPRPSAQNAELSFYRAATAPSPSRQASESVCYGGAGIHPRRRDRPLSGVLTPEVRPTLGDTI